MKDSGPEGAWGEGWWQARPEGWHPRTTHYPKIPAPASQAQPGAPGLRRGDLEGRGPEQQGRGCGVGGCRLEVLRGRGCQTWWGWGDTEVSVRYMEVAILVCREQS